LINPSRADFVPVEIRPDVSAAIAAGGARETISKIRQPHVVRPLIGADPDPVRALIVGAKSGRRANSRARLVLRIDNGKLRRCQIEGQAEMLRSARALPVLTYFGTRNSWEIQSDRADHS